MPEQPIEDASIDLESTPHSPADALPRNDDEEASLDRLRIRNQSAREDITLKKRYGNGLLIALAIQLVIMNAIFAAVGFTWLKYEQWALHLYVTGTLIEIFALVLVVTKYLFPQATKE